jgi:hypothetical protein
MHFRTMGSEAMRVRKLLGAIGVVVAAGAFVPLVGAGVAALTNHAPDKVSFALIQPDGRQTQQELDRIDCFHADGKKLELLEQPIPRLSPPPANSPAPNPSPNPRDSFCTVPVKLLVDDKEPRVRRIWEKQYRERIIAASAIIERYCRVRFEVVAVGTWTSDDKTHDFLQLMMEFERKVQPAPARLAIGFTAQYETLREDKRMGGAKGPFRPHVLIREWGRQVTEPERLEMLVHELGHYLGAVHSPEPQSVMRPDLSDRQSRARNFRIRFDAANALIVRLLGEELRKRPLTHLGQLPSATKDQLRPVYKSLAAALPHDPAAPRHLAMLNQVLPPAPQATSPAP